VEIERYLGYSFRNPDILADALTHKSFYHENPDTKRYYNERLEFLGDTILGLVIAELLYRREPPLPESEMARIKSYLVSGKVLSSIARNMDLGRHLHLGKGEIETGGRSKASILADSMEAIFGAVFIDGGFEKAKEVILRLYAGVVEESLSEKKYVDHKTELQELSQSRYGILPLYRIVGERGLEHEKLFEVEVVINGEVMGTGTGTSKKKAEAEAARQALAKIAAGP